MAKYANETVWGPAICGGIRSLSEALPRCFHTFIDPWDWAMKCCIGATKSAPLAASIHIIVEHRASELAY